MEVWIYGIDFYAILGMGKGNGLGLGMRGGWRLFAYLQFLDFGGLRPAVDAVGWFGTRGTDTVGGGAV